LDLGFKARVGRFMDGCREILLCQSEEGGKGKGPTHHKCTHQCWYSTAWRFRSQNIFKIYEECRPYKKMKVLNA
jgi:hypothetical protein